MTTVYTRTFESTGIKVVMEIYLGKQAGHITVGFPSCDISTDTDCELKPQCVSVEHEILGESVNDMWGYVETDSADYSRARRSRDYITDAELSDAVANTLNDVLRYMSSRTAAAKYSGTVEFALGNGFSLKQ